MTNQPIFQLTSTGEVQVNLRAHQLEVIDQLKRFNVLLAHRRFGKTVLALIWLILRVLECPHNRPQGHYFAPSYAQAKRVAWSYLKEFLSSLEGTQFNEQELKATLPTGATIQLGSADNPDASRGIYSDACVLDEPAQMPSRMWSEIIRPALSDRKGHALFIGTPNGRHGLFYDVYTEAANLDDWWSGVYRVSETKIIDEHELQSARATMSIPEYEQEYECSFDAAILGAYYGTVMTQLEAQGQLTTVLYDKTKPVHISLDLGISDSTACWFFQTDGNKINLIDYQEYQNSSLIDIVQDWRKKPYHYGKVICPHDVKVRSLSTGQTRKQTLTDLGVDVVVAPNLPIMDGIEYSRLLLSRCYFDTVSCKHGIECLRQYRSEFSDKHGVLQLRPLHNFASHGADAFRYLAVTPLDTLTNTWSQVSYDLVDRRPT